MPLAEDQHPVGDLGLGCEHEPFRVSVRVGVRARAAGRDLHDLHPGPGQHCVERLGDLSGPVAGQEPEARGSTGDDGVPSGRMAKISTKRSTAAGSPVNARGLSAIAVLGGQSFQEQRIERFDVHVAQGRRGVRSSAPRARGRVVREAPAETGAAMRRDGGSSSGTSGYSFSRAILSGVRLVVTTRSRVSKFRNDQWVFGDKDTGAYLPKPSWTDIVWHTLVKGGASPDDPALAGYRTQRRQKVRPPLDSCTVRLLSRQDGRCGLCGENLLAPDQLPQSPRAGSTGSCGSPRRRSRRTTWSTTTRPAPHAATGHTSYTPPATGRNIRPGWREGSATP